MKDAMENVAVALVADGNYKIPLMTTAASIAAYSSLPVDFHFFVTGFHDGDRVEVENIVKRQNGGVTIAWHDIDQKTFAALPEWKGNRMTWVRMLFPRLLKEYEYVIYADVDTLWLTDIAELWAYRNDSVIGCFRHDDYPESYKNDADYLKLNDGIELKESEYFCGGIALYNLQKMREEDFLGTSFKWLETHRDVPMVDQTMYNALLRNRAKLVPLKWGGFASVFPAIVV